jgi:hypothetical protein
MKKSVLSAMIAAALVSPSAAFAQPVFLICTLTDRGGESVFEVQLNEEASSVSYLIRRNGLSVKERAIFTPQKVSFAFFEIDRRDLTFRRDNSRSAFYSVTGGPAFDVGKCRVDSTERAF